MSHRYRLRNRAKFLFAVVFVLTLLTGGGLWAAGYFNDFLYNVGVSDTPSSDSFKGRLNVLVLGVDTRKGEKTARADTIMFCSLDTEKNVMSVLSIPRDTRVRISGHGWEKINSATAYGGPTLAMKTVSDLLGIRVNNYVMTNYAGFKDVVDALGGVNMDIKERMYHYDPEDGGVYTIDLKPGMQRLDGTKALQFVRYRGYALGDIGRTEQQQKFLSALVKEVFQPSTVVRLPSLLVSTYKAVDTNLSLLEMKKLASAAGKMTNANLLTQTLPGKFLNADGASYWEPDPSMTRQVVAGILEGREVGTKVVLGETTLASAEPPASPEAQKADQGKIVPGQPGTGQIKDTTKTGTSVTPSKSGSTGQTPAGGTAGTTGSSGNKLPAGGATGTTAGGKTQASPGKTSGGIVPPSSAPGSQAVKEPPVTVIITPQTSIN